MIPLELTAQFECANATNIERLGDAEFALETSPDGAVDNEKYRHCDYYVAFRLINPNDAPAEATVTYRERAYPETGRTVGVRDRRRGEMVSYRDWRPLEQDRAEIIDDRSCRLTLTVQPHASLDVSSMYWLGPSELCARLGEIVSATGGKVRVESVGVTAQGRTIPLVDLSALSPADKPLCMFGATPQCHELGTIASLEIILAAIAGELDDVLSRARLMALPLTNPDGNALGMCMANSLRQNIIFGFGPAGTGKAAVECEAVWRAITERSPAMYLEYHSYPHLNRPSFRPYSLDLSLFRDDESRERGRVFFEAVKAVAPNPSVHIDAGSPMDKQFRPSLISRLVADRGIPATLYKLHNRETIADNAAHAMEVLRAAVASVT